MDHRLALSASQGCWVLQAKTLTWEKSSTIPRTALVVWPCLVDSTPPQTAVEFGSDVMSLLTAAVSGLRVIEKSSTASLKVWISFKEMF